MIVFVLSSPDFVIDHIRPLALDASYTKTHLLILQSPPLSPFFLSAFYVLALCRFLRFSISQARPGVALLPPAAGPASPAGATTSDGFERGVEPATHPPRRKGAGHKSALSQHFRCTSHETTRPPSPPQKAF